jgi:hypothetical protein
VTGPGWGGPRNRGPAVNIPPQSHTAIPQLTPKSTTIEYGKQPGRSLQPG